MLTFLLKEPDLHYTLCCLSGVCEFVTREGPFTHYYYVWLHFFKHALCGPVMDAMDFVACVSKCGKCALAANRQSKTEKALSDMSRQGNE